METLEEEYDWRKSAAVESPSRIKWGYDPRATTRCVTRWTCWI